jgi:hypothetical protein
MRSRASGPLFSRRARVGACVLGLLLMTAELGAWGQHWAHAEAGSGKYAIIASQDIADSAISFDELRQIMLFQKSRLGSGQVVEFVLPTDSAPGWKFLEREIYRSDWRATRRRILMLQYQGKLPAAPRMHASDRELIAAVREGRSLISIVAARSVVGAEVRTLAIDGRLPSAPGYRISDTPPRDPRRPD